MSWRELFNGQYISSKCYLNKQFCLEDYDGSKYCFNWLKCNRRMLLERHYEFEILYEGCIILKLPGKSLFCNLAISNGT